MLQVDGGDGGRGHWLVRMEWRPAGWSLCLPLLISPGTIKSRSSLLALAHPCGPRKRAVKRLWWWWWLQVDVALQLGTPFQLFHQHLMFMLDAVMTKADRRIFNSLSSTSAVVDFLRDCYGVTQRCDSSKESAIDSVDCEHLQQHRDCESVIWILRNMWTAVILLCSLNLDFTVRALTRYQLSWRWYATIFWLLK